MNNNKYNVNEGQSGAGQGTVLEGVNDVHCGLPSERSLKSVMHKKSQ